MAVPSPAVSASVPCPKCGAVTVAGARFCNACGAPLASANPPVAAGAPPSAAAPSSASPPPVDIRQEVEGDRGVLKRLQLLVPGFRGYREGEDIRAADSLLRRQVADRIKNVRITVENSRSTLANAGAFQALNDLAPLIADLLRLEGQIRAAEQGYTGISPALRIKPQQLDRLYEYDYGFAQAADQLSQTVAPLAGLTGSSAGSVGPILSASRAQVLQIDQAFRARIQVIENIRVTE